MLAKLVLWAIQRAYFSPADKALFTSTLLRKFGVIDLRAILEIGEGKVLVRNVPLSQEQVMALRASARTMLASRARKLVRQQVISEAVNIGFTTAQNFNQTEFARAAVWFGTREEEIYELLAGRQEDEELAL